MMAPLKHCQFILLLLLCLFYFKFSTFPFKTVLNKTNQFNANTIKIKGEKAYTLYLQILCIPVLIPFPWNPIT